VPFCFLGWPLENACGLVNPYGTAAGRTDVKVSGDLKRRRSSTTYVSYSLQRTYTTGVKNIASLISAAALLSTAALASASTLSLGAANGYNAFVLGNFTESGTDSVGAIAVGGNFAPPGTAVSPSQAATAAMALEFTILWWLATLQITTRAWAAAARSWVAT
jgi:hypothetical protein